VKALTRKLGDVGSRVSIEKKPGERVRKAIQSNVKGDDQNIGNVEFLEDKQKGNQV